MTSRDAAASSAAVARAVLVGTTRSVSPGRAAVGTILRFAIVAALVTFVAQLLAPSGLAGACMTSGLLAFYFVATRSALRT